MNMNAGNVDTGLSTSCGLHPQRRNVPGAGPWIWDRWSRWVL